MEILLISGTFMGPKIGSNQNNYGGAETFINNFCISFSKFHNITLLSVLDAECNIDNVTLIKVKNYSRSYIEEQTNNKARCNNGFIAKYLKETNLSRYDLIIDNSNNNSILTAIYNNSTIKGRVVSLFHSRPSYAGMGLNESLTVKFNLKDKIKYFSVTESASSEWDKLSISLFGSKLMSGYYNLRVVDTYTNDTSFNYDDVSCTIIGRIDPIKNFGMFNQIALDNPLINFDAWALLIPCGQKCYDSLGLDTKYKDLVNLRYHLNRSIEDKYNWIKKNNPMTLCLSSTENGGTTCLESMMLGLPICVVNFKENGCYKYITDGKLIYSDPDNRFIITSHGIGLQYDKKPHLSFKEAIQIAKELKPFNSDIIREYYIKNYSFTNESLDIFTN